MNRLKKISILTAAMLFAASFAFADEVGRFVSVEGKVDLLKAGGAEAVSANADDIVSTGDAIRTKSQSKAEIKFSDNSSLKIAENSRVRIKEYNVENGKRTSGSILLERGSIRATVSKASGKNDFKIETPNAAGSVKGTDLFVVFQKSATSVLVVNGKFSVANLAFPDKVVDITSGNAALITADEPPQAAREYLALEKSGYETATEPTVRKAVALKKEAAAEGYTEPGEMGAKITAVSGSVQIRNRSSITWHDAKTNELLNAGDTIETKENGKIQIRLDNGNVIDLKPDSQLMLQKLTQDPKSGDYQNLFESSHGKLRAKVGKLKGDSKFEIKTPTAVAAVRGTIMYLNILPGLTSTYFEEGNGFVTNTISGNSQVVPAGNSSTSDGQGNVSNPAPESESGSSGWHEGWGSGGGAEGYSAPEGGTAADTGNTGGTDLGAGGSSNTPFSNVPITETDSSLITDTTSGETSELAATTVKWGGFGTYNDQEIYLDNGHIEGSLKVTGESLWTGSPSATFTGTFSNPYGDKLWGADLQGTTTDGAAFYGTIGGTDVTNLLDSKLIAIYIRPNVEGNRVGYIKSTGDISGNFSPGTGTFVSNGNLTAYDMGTTTYMPADLYDSSPAFDSGGDFKGVVSGDISGTISGESLELHDQTWGLWRLGSGGTFTGSPSANWNAIVSGLDGYSSNGAGAWIGNVTEATWSDDNKLSAAARGVSLNYHYDGTGVFELDVFEGNLLGTHEGNTWQALGIGTSKQKTTLNYSDITRIDSIGNGLGNGSTPITGLIVGQGFDALPGFPDTGAVKAVLAGTGTLGSNWRLALGDKSIDQAGAVDGYGLMTAMGNADSGTYRGVYFDPDRTIPGTFKVGSDKGNITYINQVDTTWTATATGQWVSLAELSTSALGFDQTALANMVSVPITETYASMLTGSGNLGAGTITNAQMDISFFADVSRAVSAITFSGKAGGTYTGAEAGSFQGVGAGTWTQDTTSGIWAALFNGNYTNPGAAATTGSIAFNDNAGTTANLTNLQWHNDNTWDADVTGNHTTPQ